MKILAAMNTRLSRVIGHGKIWLVLGLAVREYRQRYQGSLLGPFWPFLYTCTMVALYSFVFSIVLKVKWEKLGGNLSTEQPFWMILLAGQLVYFLVAEIATKAPVLITAVPNYVKKIIFPLELLPIVSLLVALANAAITYGVLLLFSIIHNGFSWLLLLSPFVFIPISLWCLGLGWLLGAVGVYFRDLQQVMPLVVQLLTFATPIFYPVSAVPENFRFLINLNPLTTPLDALRDLMLWQRLPDLGPLVLVTLSGGLFAWISYVIFQRLRQSFGDVL